MDCFCFVRFGLPGDLSTFVNVGDLHLANYLFHRGRAGAIDFSDCGWGHFVHDMAAALVFVQYKTDWSERNSAECASLRDAYVDGYLSARALP